MSMFGKLGRLAASRNGDRPHDRADHEVRDRVRRLEAIASESLRRSLLADPRYLDPRRLTRHGYKAYSQYTEDGLLDEIFRRIGETDRFFVEFGVGDGLENNTAYRLALGWRGVWIDSSPGSLATIRAAYAPLIEAGRLTAVEAMVSAANVQDLFARSGVPAEFDLLSIDIDGNDYWVWQAIDRYSPRVVVVEYNAGLGPSLRWSMPDGPEHATDRERSFGASLKAFEVIGRQKGYSLVGCELSGVNAFFVRSDLIGDRFLAPHDSETHFEPPRYFMLPFPGHPPSHREVLAMVAGLGSVPESSTAGP